MAEPARLRRRRTFTMEDESYERLSDLARSANTNRSRFLEHLILMAEQVLAWQPPEPPRRPWWKFWQRQPQTPAPPLALDVTEPMVVDGQARLGGRESVLTLDVQRMNGVNGYSDQKEPKTPPCEHRTNTV